ncbi:MAG: ribosome maturation factor RimP [Gloeocapsa sp. DLM2.Bin57]|nr:MAG: ribosome maturation factor RimP [Gloeocapsa sp. DLM2.Bin57]
MTHPIVPDIMALATPIASQLGLEVVEVVFQTNRRPPVLRVDIRNLTDKTGLDDCEKMSRALEQLLDESNLIEGSYVLEVSSPGTSRILTTDREFIAFKGFDVIIKAHTPWSEPKQWRGKLQGRDETQIYLNQKGKSIALPRENIVKVQLDDQA